MGEDALRNGDWIQTYTHRQFWPLDPRPEEIFIEDIAHALSMLCRFTGHVSEFYSVAQHSVLVSYYCDDSDARWGLLHDASEAYLVDVPRPVKKADGLAFYRAAEDRVQSAICQRFGLSPIQPSSVTRADGRMCATEARDLMAPFAATWTPTGDPYPARIDPWAPKRAERLFLDSFQELFGVRA